MSFFTILYPNIKNTYDFSWVIVTTVKCHHNLWTIIQHFVALWMKKKTSQNVYRHMFFTSPKAMYILVKVKGNSSQDGDF